MKQGYVKVFCDKKMLAEMLELRRKGCSLKELGKKYNVDHSTILYQCKKHGVKPEISLSKIIRNGQEKRARRTRKPRPKKLKYEDKVFPKLNKGMSYKNYIKQAKSRGEDLYPYYKIRVRE